MERDSFESFEPLEFQADGVCDWCHSDPKEGGEKLKKCSGCSTVLYCSRTCQVKAWPKHKKMCRLHTGTKESTAYMGYASAAAMTKALRRWASIHMWTLQRVVEILAHKMGRGVDDHLANQCAVELVLAPATPDPADPDNPAKAFLLESGTIAARTERDFLDANWPRVEEKCRDYTQRMRPKLRAAEREAFAGFIPAVFHFEMTGVASFTQYPLYRLRGHGSDPARNPPRTEEQFQLFDDMSHLYVGMMNMGMVLRAPGGDDNSVFPEAGFYRPIGQRNLKSWTWVAGPGWDWEEPTPAPAPWGTVPDMMRKYHGLLAQRNFIVDGFYYDPPE